MSAEEILYHITIAGKADDLVVTQRGQMTYIQWLNEVEIPRLRRKCDWPIAIYTNPSSGEISLVHLRVRMPDATAIPQGTEVHVLAPA